jgi:hypothetical protein
MLASPAAAAPAQRCGGPGSTSQAGRVTVQPGLSKRAVKQTFTFSVHLFSCTSNATGGSGTLKGSFTTGAVTCGLIKTAHTLHVALTVQWKNAATSTLALSLSFAPGRLIELRGSVGNGVFKGHAVTGEYSYMPVVSPSGNSFATACANTAPVGWGRVSVIGLNVYRTKAFVIA